MYDTATPLDLNYMNQQHLPHRYDSEEEEISESELGGQDHAFSPLNTSTVTGILYSDMDFDMNDRDMDISTFPRLLSPFPSTGKASRPVSMDTVKRSSGATFVTDSYIFDRDDDDMIIELPSPNSTTPLQSPIYLQPAVYVPSESLSSPRNISSRSPSPSSVYTDDESDIFVAEQVTYVEPIARPNLILISTPTEQSSPVEEPVSPESSNGSVYSLEQAAKSQPLLSETSMDRGGSRYHARLARGSLHTDLGALETTRYHSQRTQISEPYSASAAEMRQSISLRSNSMSFSRPQTAFAESSPSLVTTRSRLQSDQSRRPPSVQSTATFSLFPSAQSRTYYADESRSRSISCSHSVASSEYSLSSQTSQTPSRTPSPTPYYSHAFNRSRSSSIYGASSTSASHPKRPPMPYRGSVIKGSNTLNGYSSSSLRSEIEHPQPPPEPDTKLKSRRKKSLRHIRTSYSSKVENPEVSTAKSLVGFMLRGKRKSIIKTSNA